MRAFLGAFQQQGKSIGLVPTMGALHEGHLRLIRESKQQNDITVCSIFVNPAQFNLRADLDKYPRTVESDSLLLERDKCEVLFLPSAAEMYPAPESMTINVGSLDQVLEGQFRPGHFSGVALVVSKLFNIVQPTRAFFGQKDFQQVQVIKKLILDFNYPIELKIVPTVRESDGLAMSSRNQRLTADQRTRGLVLFQSLMLAKQLLKKGTIWSEVKSSVATEFLKANVQLEYFEMADAENLNLLTNVVAGTNAILLVAAYVSEVRLIDNMMLHED